VWEVVGDVERVARCLPGFEEVSAIDGESWKVRVTQSLGPMKATFDAKMHVTAREPGRSISFAATGRTVRGAAGNVRLSNVVRLEDEGEDSTRVLLEADVAMGGMLGAVGQKVVGRQAAQAAKDFAAALEREVRAGG
jgi:carbon monoxide dehydrogenase subunit G